MYHMLVVMKRDRERQEKELEELIKGKYSKMPEKPPDEPPAVFLQKEKEEEWWPTEEEHNIRYGRISVFIFSCNLCFMYSSLCILFYNLISVYYELNPLFLTEFSFGGIL